MSEADVIRDVATETTKTFLKELLPEVLRRLRALPWKRRHLLKELPTRLRECVIDLRRLLHASRPRVLHLRRLERRPQTDGPMALRVRPAAHVRCLVRGVGCNAADGRSANEPGVLREEPGGAR